MSVVGDISTTLHGSPHTKVVAVTPRRKSLQGLEGGGDFPLWGIVVVISVQCFLVALISRWQGSHQKDGSHFRGWEGGGISLLWGTKGQSHIWGLFGISYSSCTADFWRAEKPLHLSYATGKYDLIEFMKALILFHFL